METLPLVPAGSMMSALLPHTTSPHPDAQPTSPMAWRLLAWRSAVHTYCRRQPLWVRCLGIAGHCAPGRGRSEEGSRSSLSRRGSRNRLVSPLNPRPVGRGRHISLWAGASVSCNARYTFAAGPRFVQIDRTPPWRKSLGGLALGPLRGVGCLASLLHSLAMHVDCAPPTRRRAFSGNRRPIFASCRSRLCEVLVPDLRQWLLGVC
mmetsp:Transcript_72656/g.210342  ORF Transcript_72656/g.210342 Transcript_72656/m.210342 type:complete len:206 (+) Transcript_72656:182-799(+)